VIYYTRIEGGKITSRKVRELLSQDGEVEITIRPRRKYPGPPIMRWYRGTLVPILVDYYLGEGNTLPNGATIRADHVHRWLCSVFLVSARYDPETDGYELFRKSTSKLTSEEFDIFVVRVEKYITVDLELKLPKDKQTFLE